jgi:glucosamine--fructose-6-phosphate aminotransferase (isomerizing)
MPKIDEVLYPISEIIPIQLLSYYAALQKNTDPDYPRNLAKSVTVK